MTEYKDLPIFNGRNMYNQNFNRGQNRQPILKMHESSYDNQHAAVMTGFRYIS